MAPTATTIAGNLQDVRQRMAAASLRSGRQISDVRLVAVTKSATTESVQELISLGELDLGESRPQQLLDRAPLFDKSIRWHMIGSLQRNKVRRVLPVVDLIHSVDSIRLLDAINRIAEEENLRPRVLLEVNISGEEAKHGFRPDELLRDSQSLANFHMVDIRGFMTMAPLVDDPEAVRPVFRGLRQFRDQFRTGFSAGSFPELSMGMSNDFEVAIEEGATLVRIGSDLFRGLSDADS